MLLADAPPVDPDAAGLLGTACCAIAVVVPLMLAVVGLLLQTGCRVARVPVPPLGRAVGIMFVVALLNSLVTIPISLGIRLAMGYPAIRQRVPNNPGPLFEVPDIVSQMLTIPLGALIVVFLLRYLLPCTTRQGVIIWGVFFLVGVVLSLISLTGLFLMQPDVPLIG